MEAYWLLTVVLVALAAWMLYLWFRGLSRLRRGKSIQHHAPPEFVMECRIPESGGIARAFQMEVNTADPHVAEIFGPSREKPQQAESEADCDLSEGEELGSASNDDGTTSNAEAIETELECPSQAVLDAPAEVEVEAPKSEEREYLDELQEAAAGLAELMRSSPASSPRAPVAPGRRERVVFAPDEVEFAEAEEKPEASDDQDALSEVSPSSVVEDRTDLSVDVDEAANSGDEPVPEAKQVQAVQFDPDVRARFDSLDEGLDELESLVLSLESGVTGLAAIGEESGQAEVAAA
ncbi:MAG: hypothetical protein AAF236_13950 [Verrucomicrobiota bacterium]